MNKFSNIVVYIPDDEETLQEVRQLLESKGEKIYSTLFKISTRNSFNYCKKAKYGEWILFCKDENSKELTLDEFKQLINQ